LKKKNIKSVVDYAIGVEVGLDTNAGKIVAVRPWR